MHYPLAERFKCDEEKTVDLILETTVIERLYLLGTRLQEEATENIFTSPTAAGRRPAHYWLLALLPSGATQGCNETQESIENACQHFIPVTAIVLSGSQFNEWLEQGHRFAKHITAEAVLLYGEPFSLPPVIENSTEEAIRCYTQSHNRVKEFMAGAALFLLRNQTRLAAFMLHQAAEQALLYIFKSVTGLQLITHNIDKLLRCCTLVNSGIPFLFSPKSEADERLLKLLRKAYIDARYNDGFTMSAADICTLTAKINMLQELMQE